MALTRSVAVRSLAVVSAFALAAAGQLVAAFPASADIATDTYVSGVGDDSNPCISTAPCKTFSGAIAKTADGGTIHALDSGGFGSLTITKSITIDGSGFESSVLTSGTNGITVVGAGINVVLRGLAFLGVSGSGACGGLSAVNVQQAASVRVENSRIAGFANAGVLVSPTSGSTSVALDGVDIRNGCSQGVEASSSGGGTSSVSINNSTIAGTQVGIKAGFGGMVSVANSLLYANKTATLSDGGVVDTSATTNQIVGNDVSLLPTSPGGGAASRTWVSASGDNVNPCSRTAPCRTFAGSMSKTLSGGEIDVLDSGDFGPLTITKPITIDGTGATASINSAASGSGIKVNVAADQDVILRNLTINSASTGSLGCSYSSINGIQVLGGRVVNIENVNIVGSLGDGISIAPSSSKTRVLINGGNIQQSCGSAVNDTPGSGDSTAFIRNTTMDSSQVGVTAGAGAHIWVAGSTVSNNQLGLQPISGGQLDTFYGTNTYTGNTTNGSPTSEIGTPPAPPAPTPPALSTPGTQKLKRCAALPKKLKRNSIVKWQKKVCKTDIGQKVKFSIKGKGKLVRKAKGKIFIKTGKKGKVTLAMSAPATATYAQFRVAKTYKLK